MDDTSDSAAPDILVNAGNDARDAPAFDGDDPAANAPAGGQKGPACPNGNGTPRCFSRLDGPTQASHVALRSCRLEGPSQASCGGRDQSHTCSRTLGGHCRRHSLSHAGRRNLRGQGPQPRPGIILLGRTGGNRSSSSRIPDLLRRSDGSHSHTSHTSNRTSTMTCPMLRAFLSACSLQTLSAGPSQLFILANSQAPFAAGFAAASPAGRSAQRCPSVFRTIHPKRRDRLVAAGCYRCQ